MPALWCVSSISAHTSASAVRCLCIGIALFCPVSSCGINDRLCDQSPGAKFRNNFLLSLTFCYFSTTLGKVVIGIGLVLLLALIVLLVVIGVKILVYVIIPVAAILFIVNLIISLIDNHRM